MILLLHRATTSKSPIGHGLQNAAGQHLPPKKRGAIVVALMVMLVSSCSPGSSATEPSLDVEPDGSATTSTASDEPSTSAQPTPDLDSAIIEPGAETTEGGTSDLTQIVVDSTPQDYFVLYVRPDPAADREIPIAVVRGEAGTTTLSDHRSQLPESQYRVEVLSVESPGDVDGDGIDDLTELADPVSSNPLNPAGQLDFGSGAVMVEDRVMFEALSYQGDEVARDAYLAGLEFVKFLLLDTDTTNPTLYFMNTETFRAHPRFAAAIGITGMRGPSPGVMRGDIVYNPEGIAPDGSLGTYRFAFQPNDAYSFEEIAVAFEMLSSGMPFLTNNLLYEPYPAAALPLYEKEQATYDAYRIPILLGQ